MTDSCCHPLFNVWKSNREKFRKLGYLLTYVNDGNNSPSLPSICLFCEKQLIRIWHTSTDSLTQIQKDLLKYLREFTP